MKINYSRKHSSIVQFIAYIVPLVLIVSLVFLTILTIRTHQEIHSNLKRKIVTILEKEQGVIARPLWNVNTELTSQILKAIMADPDVAGLSIYNDHNELFSSTGVIKDMPFDQMNAYFAHNSFHHQYQRNLSHLLLTLLSINEQPNGILFHGEKDVYFKTDYGSERVGKLFVVLSSANQDMGLRDRLKQDFFLMSLVLFSVIVSCIVAYWKTTLTPLRKLLEAIDSAKEKRFKKIEGYKGKSEIDIVIQTFNAFQEKQLEHQYYLETQKTTLESQVDIRTKELLVSQEKYKNLVESTSDWIWEIDKELKYTYVSQNIEKILGYSPEELLKKSPFDLMLEDEANRIKKLFSEIALTRKPFKDIENWNIDKNGNEICLLINGLPIFDDNRELIGYRGVGKEITTQKKLEAQNKKAEMDLRQAQKMEAIGTISGGIAHDFNNILSIIIGNTELALENISEGISTQNNLEEIKIASFRARDVVRQLLTFSRKTEKEKKTIEIKPIIEESIKLLRSSIPTSIDIQFEALINSGKINADSTQIHQVLINLCTNAAHAMEKEGGTLGIKLSGIKIDATGIDQYKDISPGNYIKLTISDTGHGINKETQAKIFDPYFTTKEVGKGTGMGLSVVLGIVKSLNGAISVYSEPNKGSTFKVFLPSVVGETAIVDQPNQDIPKGDESILLVDDEESLIKAGVQIIGGLGYQVHSETDPIIALDLFKSDPSRFDLIITDMTMPFLTGDLLAQEILKIKPDMPIILCTGFSSKIDKDKAKRIGICRYVEKPFNKIELAKTIRESLC